MISPKLQTAFVLLEIATYGEWEKADKKGKERIARRVAKIEADLIIKEINETAAKMKFDKLETIVS